MDILIRSALVQDGQLPLDIGIREGVTYKLEPRIDDPAAQVLDAAGRATIPGLIEPHIHLDKALLESRLANRSGTLEEAIRVTGILKRKQEYRDVLDRSRQVLEIRPETPVSGRKNLVHVKLVYDDAGLATKPNSTCSNKKY